MRKKTENEFDAAMKKAASILSKRMHSSHEIKNKLIRKFPLEVVNETIKELERLDYINDARFATAYATELQNKGLGRRLIINKMARRGIAQSLCEDSTPKESLSSEKEHAMEFLKSRKKMLDREPDTRKKKEKIFRMLKSRGFSNEIIFTLINLN